MTKAYAVSTYSIMKYIYDGLLKAGIKLSFTHAAALAQLVNATLAILIPRELELMNALKSSVADMGAKVTWALEPLSEFKPYFENYMESTT